MDNHKNKIIYIGLVVMTCFILANVLSCTGQGDRALKYTGDKVVQETELNESEPAINNKTDAAIGDSEIKDESRKSEEAKEDVGPTSSLIQAIINRLFLSP